MSRPESVSSRIGELRLEQRHLEDLVALLLAAREAFVDRAAQHALVDVEELRLLLDQLHELHRVELGQALVLALGVDRRLEEVGVVHAGNLDRVLERHEHAFAGALVGIHVEQVLAVEGDVAAGHLVLRVAGQRTRQRALARAVRPHDGVHLAGVDGEVDPLEDLLAFGPNLQILDSQHAMSSRRILRVKRSAASALRRRTPSAARGRPPCRSR